MSLVKFITHGMPKSSLFLLFMPIFHRIFFTGNAAIRRRMVFLLKIPISFSSICHRVCLKNHSRNLHAPLCGIFHPNSVAVARYGALIRAKYPTNCDAHLAESLFQTRSSSPEIFFLCWTLSEVILYTGGRAAWWVLSFRLRYGQRGRFFRRRLSRRWAWGIS